MTAAARARSAVDGTFIGGLLWGSDVRALSQSYAARCSCQYLLLTFLKY
jgi:hypothetical protein